MIDLTFLASYVSWINTLKLYFLCVSITAMFNFFVAKKLHDEGQSSYTINDFLFNSLLWPLYWAHLILAGVTRLFVFYYVIPIMNEEIQEANERNSEEVE